MLRVLLPYKSTFASLKVRSPIEQVVCSILPSITFTHAGRKLDGPLASFYASLLISAYFWLKHWSAALIIQPIFSLSTVHETKRRKVLLCVQLLFRWNGSYRHYNHHYKLLFVCLFLLMKQIVVTNFFHGLNNLANLFLRLKKMQLYCKLFFF